MIIGKNIGKVTKRFISLRSLIQGTKHVQSQLQNPLNDPVLVPQGQGTTMHVGMLAQRGLSRIAVIPDWIPKLPKQGYGATRSNKEYHRSSMHCSLRSSRSFLGNQALRCGAVPCSLGPAPGREVER